MPFEVGTAARAHAHAADEGPVDAHGEELSVQDPDASSDGVTAPFSCREGECSACAVRLIEGEVKMLHNDVLDEEDLAEGIRLGCQSVPVTDTVKVTYH